MMTTAAKARLWRSDRAAYFTSDSDSVDPRQPAPVAHRLGRLRQAARFQHRLSSRRVRIHAAPDVLGRRHVDVRAQFLSKIVVAA